MKKPGMCQAGHEKRILAVITYFARRISSGISGLSLGAIPGKSREETEKKIIRGKRNRMKSWKSNETRRP